MAEQAKGKTSEVELRAKEHARQLDRSIVVGESGIEVTNLEQMARFAAWAKASGLTKLKSVEEIVIALQTGAELGFSLMQSLQVVDVMDGRPSLRVEAQAAKVEADGAIEPGTKCYYRFEGDGENLACIAWSHPRGGEKIESEPVYLHEFKHLRNRDNWKNYPKRLLKARAVGWHIRDFYAMSVRNLPTSEELQDLRSLRGHPAVPPERDVTPPKGADPLLEDQFPAAEAEVEDAEYSDTSVGCEHPDGFSKTEENPDPHCVHCGMVREEQRPLI